MLYVCETKKTKYEWDILNEIFKDRIGFMQKSDGPNSWFLTEVVGFQNYILKLYHINPMTLLLNDNTMSQSAFVTSSL